MIKTNYVLSLLLHSLLVFYLLIFFEFNKSKNTYPESININIQALPVIKKNEQMPLEKNYLPTKKKKKEIKLTKKKNTTIKSNTKIIPTKKNKKAKEKQTIEKQKNIPKNNKKFKTESEKKNNAETENNSNNYKIKKNKKSENILKQTFSNNETQIFNDYNDELKALIQEKATQNYPPASLRRNEEGAVELSFSIDVNGNIFNIKKEKKTNASDRLINSAIETLNLISPYKRNNILKKKNTFSIIIVYKLR